MQAPSGAPIRLPNGIACKALVATFEGVGSIGMAALSCSKIKNYSTRFDNIHYRPVNRQVKNATAANCVKRESVRVSINRD
jgi:hypothetical protein